VSALKTDMPRLGYGPGRLRRASNKRRRPIWRLPNVILEPWGAFQSYDDERLERLDSIRTLVGVLLTIALLLRFGGNPATVWHDFLSNTDGCDSFCDTNTFWGSWLTSVFVAIWVAVGVLLVLGIVIGLTCEVGYRWVTVRRLWRPVLSIIGGFLLLYLSIGVVVGVSLIVPQGPAYDPVMVAVLVLVGVYEVKVLHLAAKNLFRADDVHPLLAPLATVPIACAVAFVMFKLGGDGGEHISIPPKLHVLSYVLVYFGAAVSIAMTVYTWYRLRDNNPWYAFRHGPARTGVPPVSHPMPKAVRTTLIVATLLAVPAAAAWGDAALPVYRSLMSDYNSATQASGIASTTMMPTIVSSIAISPDGKMLAAGGADGSVTLLSLTGPGESDSDAYFVADGKAGAEVFQVSFSPDSRTLAVAVQGTVYFWNVANPAHPVPYPHPIVTGTDQDHAAVFAPKGHLLAVAGWDGTIRLWNVANPAHPVLAGQHAGAGATDTLAFSADGKILASGYGNIHLWNVSDPARIAPLGEIQVGADEIKSVAFSPDGRTLAVGSGTATSNGRVDGVSLPAPYADLSYTPVVLLFNVSDPGHPAPLGPPLLAPTAIPNVQDPSSPVPSNLVFSVAFSPSGRSLVAGTNGNVVYRWDTTNPDKPFSLGAPLTGPTDWVTSVAFSPDGQTLAAGSSDGSIRLWTAPVYRAGH
jgi:WD40 repeat protein